MTKERVEVHGSRKTTSVDDFREVTLASGGKVRKYKTSRKGHVEEVNAFVDTLRSVENPPIEWKDLRSVSLTSILAAQSLREGVPFDVQLLQDIEV